MPDVPEQLKEERDAVIQEIYAAFEGVSREGTNSWRDACNREWGGHAPDEVLEWRYVGDSRWEELVDESLWVTGGISSSFSNFLWLDREGYRYYLPAAMIRSLRSGEDHEIARSLILDHPEDGAILYRWSALEGRQRLCVRRFLELMSEWIPEDEDDDESWQRALATYWAAV